MILDQQETKIVSQILKRVFGVDIAPSEVKGLQIHDTGVAQTVVIITPYALYTLGKAYFKELVTELKATIQADAVTPTPKYQEYKTPAERGIPSLKYESKSSAEIQKETERFLGKNRGIIELVDGTVWIDNDFYRLMG